MTRRMPSIVIAVKGLLVHRRKVLLLRRANTNRHGPGMWEFPGGRLEFGEDLQQALCREIEEETSLAPEVGGLLYAATGQTDPDRQIVVLCYQCTAREGAVQISSEHQDFLWATRTQMTELLNPGTQQSLTRNRIWDRLDIL